MEKSKIFIASSGRTLGLAEKLRDALETDYCEATLWSEEGRRLPGNTVIEMLETAAGNFDFAAVILARDDVITREGGEALKARDNCVFEAGLFIASLGRERCFLVNSVEQQDLPSDLGGIISLPFSEPGNLSDRLACAEAIKGVAATLKDRVQRSGRHVAREHFPTFSLEQIMLLERHNSEGGELREGQVVVCDLQPNTATEVAPYIRRNLDNGVSYLYFLQLADDTIDKIIQGLQVAVASGSGGDAVTDFARRLETVRKEPQRVLDDLRSFCHARSLRISLMPTEPQFRFRVHNASDPELARLFLRFRADAFMLWAEGASAVSLWRSLPRYIETDDSNRFFVPLKYYNLSEEERRRFEHALSRGLARYFPGIESEVRQLCVGHGD